jgi:hypothetical protein
VTMRRKMGDPRKVGLNGEMRSMAILIYRLHVPVKSEEKEWWET